MSGALVQATVQAALHMGTSGAAVGLASAKAVALANEVVPAFWFVPLRVVGMGLMLLVAGVGGLLGVQMVGRSRSTATAPQAPPIGRIPQMAASGQVLLMEDPTPVPTGAVAQKAASEPGILPEEEAMPKGAIRRLGAGRLRIGNSAFTLTPDEKSIVALSPEGILRKFDAETGRLVERRQISDRSRSYPLSQPRAQISKDGKIGTLDECSNGDSNLGTATVWDLNSGKLLFRWVGKDGSRLAYYTLSPNGKQLAFAEQPKGRGATYELWLYDLKSGQKKRLGDVDFNIYEMVFCADGKRIFVEQTDGIRRDPLPTQGVDRRGHTYACFDIAAGKEIWKLQRGGQTFAVSSDGTTLVAATFDGHFQIIQTATDSTKPIETYVTPTGFQAHPNVETTIAPDNRTLVMNHFNEIILWDFQNAALVSRIPTPRVHGSGYGRHVGPMSSDGKALWINQGSLQRWNLKTGKLFFAAQSPQMLGPIDRLAFSWDAKEIFASSWSLHSARWDVSTGKQLGFVPAVGKRLISTTGGLLDLKSGSYSGGTRDKPFEITLIDPLTSKAVRTVAWAKPEEVGINALRAYSLTTDGKTLLVAHGDNPPQNSFVTTVDVDSGRRLAHFAVPGHFVYPIPPFSPCGRWAVMSGKIFHVGGGAELYAPQAGEHKRLFPGGRSQGPIWFSPDSRLLAGRLQTEGGTDKQATDTIAVWELATGKVLASFPNSHFVDQVAFSPDNRTIALVDASGIRIHDLLTGNRMVSYAAPDVACGNLMTDVGCGAQTLAFAPDGRTLATGHQDGSITVWKVPEIIEESPGQISKAEVLWADLASDSAVKARSALARLVRNPTEALAILNARFCPLASADSARAGLVHDLDSNKFAIREAATAKLRDLGVKADGELRRALAKEPSAEKRRRVNELLEAMPAPPLSLPVSGDTLQGVRAHRSAPSCIATPAARELIQQWALQGTNLHLASEAPDLSWAIRRTERSLLLPVQSHFSLYGGHKALLLVCVGATELPAVRAVFPKIAVTLYRVETNKNMRGSLRGCRLERECMPDKVRLPDPEAESLESAREIRTAIDQEYEPLLRSIAILVAKSERNLRWPEVMALASEVLHDAVGEALRNAHTFDSSRSAPAWVRGIAARLLLNRRRAENRDRRCVPATVLGEEAWAAALEQVCTGSLEGRNPQLGSTWSGAARLHFTGRAADDRMPLLSRPGRRRIGECFGCGYARGCTGAGVSGAPRAPDALPLCRGRVQR